MRIGSRTEASKSTPILTLLNKKLLPRLDEPGVSSFIIARPALRDVVVPPEVEVSGMPLGKESIAVKGSRPYGNISMVTTRWPEDHQETTRLPSLTCVIGGRTDLRLGNYVVHASEGSMIFIPPDVPHPDGSMSHLEGENRKNGSCDLLAISLRGEKVHCWICHSRGEEHIGPSPGESIFIIDELPAQLLSILTEEVMNGGNKHRRICESLLRTFLFTLQREIQEGRFLHLQDELPEEVQREKDFDPIEHAQHYVKSHLNQPLTLERMARLVYMSRAQFAKRFHEKTGETFTVYMNRCRLEQAQSFLRDTNWTVPLIAEFVGFKSPSYFHRLFRREMGISPIDFRLQERENRRIAPDS